MAGAVESTGSLQLLPQTGPVVVMATCDGAALIWDSAGWEGESVSCAANGGWVVGGSSRPGLLDFPQRLFFLFALPLPRSRDRPSSCSRRVTGVMSHHQCLLPFALLCFFAHEKKEHVKFCSLFFVRFRHSAPVVVGFFFCFLMAAARCAVREEDQSKAARSPLLCHTPQPRLTFKGPTNSLYFSFMCLPTSQKKKKPRSNWRETSRQNSE